MKHLLFILPAVFVISSCGINSAIMINHNQNATQVQLTGNNYTVRDRVSGYAEVRYILMIGGLRKKQLYENAFSNMVTKANLTGSKALVNITTEEHLGGVPPFYYKRTVTVSAHVVEFTR